MSEPFKIYDVVTLYGTSDGMAVVSATVVKATPKQWRFEHDEAPKMAGCGFGYRVLCAPGDYATSPSDALAAYARRKRESADSHRLQMDRAIALAAVAETMRDAEVQAVGRQA
jgi:hypothetical protein